MFSIGSSDPAGSPQTPWLIRIGIFSAGAMAAALVMALWAMLVTDAGAAPGAVALLLCGTAASIASACLVSHVILRLAEREQRAASDAGHDLLSGLANRKLFHSWIDYELARRRREGSRFAVMYLDIDHFKDINDRHGHDAGDRLIVEVARRLSDTLRPTDRLARFGGDEFAILQSGVRTISDAEALASRIVDAMRQPFSPGRIEVTSSASIGIAMCPDHERNAPLTGHKHGRGALCEAFTQPFVRKVLRPPSTAITCPVIHVERGPASRATTWATSSGSPSRGKGCMAAMASAICGLASSFDANGVRVSEGATQFTRTLGASSAASERIKPSTAPLAMPMDA